MTDQTAANDRTRRIAELESARRELPKTQTIDEIKEIRDLAEAIRAYSQHRDLGLELQNQAAELKLQAERRLGRQLAGMNLRGGDRKSNDPAAGLKLRDLGIDKNQSARWQLEASVPEESFRHYVLTAHAEGREISSAALLRLGRQMKQLRTVATPSVRGESKPTNVQLFAIRNEPGPRVGQVGELSELVDEVKNHGQTLTRIVESFCERANVRCDASERRAMRRYFREIENNLARIEIGLQRLAQDHRFLASAFAS